MRRARRDEELRRARPRRSPAGRGRRSRAGRRPRRTSCARSRIERQRALEQRGSRRLEPARLRGTAAMRSAYSASLVRRGVFRCSWSMARNFFASNLPSLRLQCSQSNAVDELVEREDLLVAVRPAEAREVVEHRARRVPLVAVLADAHRAVALAQLLAVRRRASSAGARTRAPRRRAPRRAGSAAAC